MRKTSSYTSALKFLQIMTVKGFVTAPKNSVRMSIRPSNRPRRPAAIHGPDVLRRVFHSFASQLMQPRPLGPSRLEEGNRRAAPPARWMPKEAPMSATTGFMQTLAWSLLHFLWQGPAIGAVAAAFMAVFHKPATRYLVGITALALMLRSSVVTFAVVVEPAATVAEFAAIRAPAAAPASSNEASAHSVDELMEGARPVFPAVTSHGWRAAGWSACSCSRCESRRSVRARGAAASNLISLPEALVAGFACSSSVSAVVASFSSASAIP